jgi:hypothetical protein
VGAIVAIPALLAALVSLRRGPHWALVAVYLPVLLILPDYYRWSIPGLPDPTFNQAAILPIAALAVLRASLRWRWSFTDVLVFGFAFTVGYSEYVNAGYGEAQNLMFDMLASVILPYVCGKLLIEPFGLRVPCARRIAWLLFLLSVISVYEFRFGRTPFRMALDGFFPGQGDGWVTTFRWGLARVAGPFGHAILAGVLFAIGYRFQRWLEWTGAWETDFRTPLPLSKPRIITLGLAAGVAMTLVRGPWIAAIAGAAVTAVGLAGNRRLAARVMLALVVLIGLPSAFALYSWASVGRANAKSDSQETAAYRKELIDKYVDIALERAPLGWGRNTWPRVPGMPSIDNYFLLLALTHGTIALGLLLSIFAWMMARLYRDAIRTPAAVLPRGGSLAFTFLGIYLVIFVAIATVYMGLQLVPVFALVTGWAEGFLLNGGDEAGIDAAPVAMPRYRFARVAV